MVNPSKSWSEDSTYGIVGIFGSTGNPHIGAVPVGWKKKNSFSKDRDFNICRDFNIFSSHGLLPSDLVAQSVEQRWSNPKVVDSIPTLVRVFLCPCVGPFPLVGLMLTWFVRDTKLALHISL